MQTGYTSIPLDNSSDAVGNRASHGPGRAILEIEKHALEVQQCVERRAEKSSTKIILQKLTFVPGPSIFMNLIISAIDLSGHRSTTHARGTKQVKPSTGSKIYRRNHVLAEQILEHLGRGILAQDHSRQPTRQGGLSRPDHFSYLVAALSRHTRISPRPNLKTKKISGQSF